MMIEANEELTVQVKNKGNSKLIAYLKENGALIKRSGDKNSQARYNSNQGLATFALNISALPLLPNDGFIIERSSLYGDRRISVKQYKEERLR